MSRLIIFIFSLVFLFSASIAEAAGNEKHYPGLFLGATHADGETDYALGFEYEYKITKNFGIGGIWERTPSGHGGDGVNVSVASFFYHPTPEWRLGLGFGEERIGGPKVKHKDLVRASAAYEMQLEKFIIAPTLAMDFVDSDEIVVLGLAVLLPF